MSMIEAIRLVSGDAEGLAAFYEAAFGFVRLGSPEPAVDPVAGPARRLVRLALGRQRIEIVELAASGSPAPPMSSDDPRFQHIAMVAPDIGPAIAGLDAVSGWSPISRGGPQTLPERSGGVTAFKFRDPEGHPLELLTFKAGGAPEPWREGEGRLLGIDHTAIVVCDTARSVAFYARLGFEHAGGMLNHGPEQARLDGVPDPHVEVTTLKLDGAGPPHLELLCYRTTGDGGGERARATCATDIVATRTVLSGTTGEALRDPDGHRWIAGSS